MPAPLETQTLFAQLGIGEPIAVLDVEIVPLILSECSAGVDATFLEEGIARGETSVHEVSESGVVGQVRVLHRGALPLLLLQGEQILGAKQNRSFNASFVLAPGKEVVLPVSCVEQGRWRHSTTSFQAGATTLSPALRAQKLRRVSDSIRMTGSYDANQHEVWTGVRDYLAATGTHSLTASYEDARRSRAQQVDTALARLRPLPDQAGLAVVQGERVLLIDVFGSPRLFARAFEKCLRGALSEASASPSRPARSGSAARRVLEALERLALSPPTRAPSPADSDTLTARGESVAYTAAVWRNTVYHCAAAG